MKIDNETLERYAADTETVHELATITFISVGEGCAHDESRQVDPYCA